MAKKQITPEQYQAKLEKKKERNKKFANLFLKTLAFCLAIAIAYSTSSLAYQKMWIAVHSQKVVSGDANASTSTSTNTNTSTSTNTSTNWDEPGSTDAGSTDTSASEESTVMTSTTMQFDLFAKALQGVKTNAKSATQLKKNAYNYKEHVDAGIFTSAGEMLMGSLLVEEETNVTYTGADISANFPPSGATSQLTKDDIQSISCKEEGDYYIITVVVKGVDNPKAGQGVGAVATIITQESIQEPIKNIPGLSGLEPNCCYEATTAEAKIEKSTGNLVEYYFDLPMILYMGNVGSIGLGFEEWWTVAY